MAPTPGGVDGFEGLAAPPARAPPARGARAPARPPRARLLAVLLPALLLPALLLPAAHAAGASPAPAPSPPHATTVFVYGPRGLRAALDDGAVSTIYLRSRDAGPAVVNVSATPAPDGRGATSGWGSAPGPATLLRGRNVTLAPAPGGNASANAAVLDLRAAPVPAIVVAAGAALRVQGLTLLAAPPADGASVRQPNHHPPPSAPPPFYAAPQLGPWPSLVLEPGAQVVFRNSTLYASGGCDTIASCVPAAVRPGVPSAGTQASIPAGAGTRLLVRAGFAGCDMPVFSGGKAVGTARVYYVDTVTVCAEEAGAGEARKVGGGGAATGAPAPPPPPPRSSAFPWWAGLIIGVCLAGIIAAAVAAGVCAASHRRKHGQLRWADAETAPPRPTAPAPAAFPGGQDSAWGRRHGPPVPPPATARPVQAPLLPVPSPFAGAPSFEGPLSLADARGLGRSVATTASTSRPAGMGTLTRSLTPAEAVGLGELRAALAAAGHPLARSLSGSGRGGRGSGRGRGGRRGSPLARSFSSSGPSSTATITTGTTPSSPGGRTHALTSSHPTLSAPATATAAGTDWDVDTLAAPLASAWTALRVGTDDDSALSVLSVGPLIGRGSYGRVYKGRWGSTGGALVAIKVIEAGDVAAALSEAAAGEVGDDGGDIPGARAARESLLSVALSHPNVVQTYRILFVDPARRRSTEVSPQEVEGGGERAAAALALAAATASEEATSAARAGGTAASPAARAASQAAEALASVPEGADGSGSASTGGRRGGGGGGASAAAGRSLGTGPAGTPEAASSATAEVERGLGTGPAGAAAPRAGDGTAAAVAAELGAEDDHSTSSRPVTPTPGRTETWLVMEYADRGTLDDAIRAGRFHRRRRAAAHLSPAGRRGSGGTPSAATTAGVTTTSSGEPPVVPDYIAILRCLLDVAAGMAYLHGVGIIHADLKPSNVLLKSNRADARGVVCKVCDFGLARLAAAATHVSTLATGTAAYQAPEALSRGRLSRPGDVFSFGIVMAELWTRVRPFAGLAIGQVVYGVVYAGARPDLPADCPPGYARLARSCWAENPEARPTFTEVLVTLRGLLQAAVAEAREVAGSGGGGGGGGVGGGGGGSGAGGRG